MAHDYIEPYPTYDKILALFMSNQAHRLDEGDIYSKFEEDKKVGVRSAMASLEEKRCIKKDSSSGNWFILLDEGSTIYNNGGFRGYLERQKIADEIKERLDSATLKMAESVVNTNNSVQNLNNNILPANFIAQEKFSNRSLWLALLSVVFIGVTAYLQYRDKTAQGVEELKQEVKETSKTLKELQSSLKEVNSSIQKIRTDTVFVKQR